MGAGAERSEATPLPGNKWSLRCETGQESDYAQIAKPGSSRPHCSPLNAPPTTLMKKGNCARRSPPQKSGFLWDLDERHFSGKDSEMPLLPLGTRKPGSERRRAAWVGPLLLPVCPSVLRR